MALLELTIIPIGTGNPSVGSFIADIGQALEKENLAYQITDMGTIVEGEPAELLEIAAGLHELPFQQGALRVVTQLRIDDRRDKKIHLGDKTAAVQARLKK
ncbi:MAG: MTH1187 family thiamine-binding protein [Thermodesulfobacteriota bacterium]